LIENAPNIKKHGVISCVKKTMEEEPAASSDPHRALLVVEPCEIKFTRVRLQKVCGNGDLGGI
jgi:hypothetical protein